MYNDYSGGLETSSSVHNNAGAGDGDANSALAELDQGLRSGRLGEQSEAIVRFPDLFAKYPFPILINSALLKLADIFRQSSNFIKLCVLRVVQESERHLDKVTNVDEFVKRFFTVLHSNDPVSRALTLRTLGAIAVIIPERKQVHHNIRNALDSHNSVELHAAIFAAGKFAFRSKTFAINMCSKISDMIKGFATPLDMKIKLIPIFQHMHHDSYTAQVVRQTCVNMLPSYPSEHFVSVTLHTLTVLSARTLVDVPDQVDLLLQYLIEDPRMSIKRRVLSDFRMLATEDKAHLWSKKNISALVLFASDCPDKGVLIGALTVLGDVVRHTPAEKLDLEDSDAPILKLCSSTCYRESLPVAARSTQLLIQLATNCKRDLHHVDGIDISSEAVMAVESLFLLLNSGSQSGNINMSIMKECLKSVCLMCRVHPETCNQFVDIIGGMLIQSEDGVLLVLCDLLSAIGNIRHGVLKPLLPEICHQIDIICSSEEQSKYKGELLIHLSTLLLQTFYNHKWTDDAFGAILACAEALDAWSVYRMGRNATRYGHHNLASKLFSLVAPAAYSEQFYYWVTGLEKVFEGEKQLNNLEEPDLIERTSNASTLILLGCTAIKAGNSQMRNPDFQINYLTCRSEMLQAISGLILACNSLRTSPPPAIAGTRADQSKDNLQRCGRINQLLRQSVKDFLLVAEMYGDLYQSSFDADPETMVHLQLLQQINSCVAQWTELVCLGGRLQGAINNDSVIEFSTSLEKPIEEHSIYIQSLVRTGENVASCFSSVPYNIPPLSDVHTDCLYNAMTYLCSSAISIPRFFYQALQQTSLKLAVTPQPRSAGEPITISNNQQLSIKAEGVITRAARSSPMTSRVIDSVQLRLNSQLVMASKSQQPTGGEIRKSESTQSLEETLVPHNDFFSAQFLISFPIAGSHSVNLETFFIDEEKRFWQTGQQVSLSIKAYEDGMNRQTLRTGGVVASGR